MAKKVYIAILGFNLMLLVMHSVVPHYHFNTLGQDMGEVVIENDISNTVFGFLQHLFHTDIGVDELQPVLQDALSLFLLVALLALGLTLLPIHKLIVPQKEFIPAPAVAYHLSERQPRLFHWQATTRNLPPPYRY